MASSAGSGNTTAAEQGRASSCAVKSSRAAHCCMEVDMLRAPLVLSPAGSGGADTAGSSLSLHAKRSNQTAGLRVRNHLTLTVSHIYGGRTPRRCASTGQEWEIAAWATHADGLACLPACFFASRSDAKWPQLTRRRLGPVCRTMCPAAPENSNRGAPAGCHHRFILQTHQGLAQHVVHRRQCNLQRQGPCLGRTCHLSNSQRSGSVVTKHHCRFSFLEG